MVDEGGSSGILRQTLSVPPVGDIRQIISNLSSTPVKETLEYRFTSGSLKGHPVGNLILAGLYKSGNVRHLHKIVNLLIEKDNVSILPATHSLIRLVAKNGKDIIRGEAEIYKNKIVNKNTLFNIEGARKPNKECLSAISSADIIVIAPGDFFCSILPTLLTPGIGTAVRKSNATKFFICNAKNEYAGLGKNITLQTYIEILFRHKLKISFDKYLVNIPETGDLNWVQLTNWEIDKQIRDQFLDKKGKPISKYDLIADRNLLVHDGFKIASTLKTVQATLKA
jgi:uncharacterized cofD-like protein